VSWNPGKKYKDLRQRLDAVELLAAYKEVYSYEELHSILGLPPSVLSRYYQGNMIPNLETSKRMVTTLLDEKRVKDYVFRLIGKYKGDASSIFTNSRALNLVGIYISFRILSRMAGSKISRIIAPPDQSAILAAIVAHRLNLQVNLIASSATTLCAELFPSIPIKRGDYVVAVYATFGRECIPSLRNFISKYKLDLKLIETVILADVLTESEIPSASSVEGIIP
jgi:hypothetical protein